MTPADLDLIERLSPRNPNLGRLMDRHRGFEQSLAGYRGRKWLSTHVEAEMRKLKRLKLAGRDQIESILVRHRRA